MLQHEARSRRSQKLPSAVFVYISHQFWGKWMVGILFSADDKLLARPSRSGRYGGCGIYSTRKYLEDLFLVRLGAVSFPAEFCGVFLAAGSWYWG